MTFPAAASAGTQHEEVNESFVGDGAKWRKDRKIGRAMAHGHGHGSNHIIIDIVNIKPYRPKGLVDIDLYMWTQSNLHINFSLEMVSGMLDWTNSGNYDEVNGYLNSSQSTYGGDPWVSETSILADSGITMNWRSGEWELAFNQNARLNFKVVPYSTYGMHVYWLMNYHNVGNDRNSMIEGSAYVNQPFNQLEKVHFKLTQSARYGVVTKVM